MPNYRRHYAPGGTYFFTVVTYDRHPWLCTEAARHALRAAIRKVQTEKPFHILAWVLLPDHLHCLWALPPGDADFSGRWRAIKAVVSRYCAPRPHERAPDRSRARRRERQLWQRRFWEHTIRDENDLTAHVEYIHYNPVKHGLCRAPAQWPYSSFHRYVREGLYAADWASGRPPAIPDSVGRE
jgi:putative transposase